MLVPRSILLGRPMPGPGEPLWTEQDLAEALAWQEEMDSRCPGCGQPADEAWNGERIAEYQGRVHTCVACLAVERAAKNLPDSADRAATFVIAEHIGGGGRD